MVFSKLLNPRRSEQVVWTEPLLKLNKMTEETVRRHADLCVTEKNTDLVENKDITCKSQPGWFAAQLLYHTEKFDALHLRELMELVKRPTLPKALFREISGRFAGDQGELQSHCYDPMSPTAEILALRDQVEIELMWRAKKESMMERLMQLFIPVLLAVLVMEFVRYAGLGGGLSISRIL